jgi:hypothetical protein
MKCTEFIQSLLDRVKKIFNKAWETATVFYNMAKEKEQENENE